MEQRRYSPGDPVIYRKSKHSTAPGPRAGGVEPSRYGEEYTYNVDKFWAVAELPASGQAILVTRRGKRHAVCLDDPNLRHARWWERWLYRERFPKLDDEAVTSAS